MLSSIGDFVQTAQSAVKHVRDIFREHPESESTPSPSQSLPPETSSQPERPIVTHANSDARPSASASMTSGSSHFKRSIVDKLVEGTYDSGFEIPDDDDDIQEIPPPSRNTRRRSDVNRPYKQPRVIEAGAGASANQRTSLSRKEQGLSETSSHYFQDRNTTNNPVRRTSRNMPFGSGRVNNNFTGALKPINTLSSSKQAHYLSNKTQPNISGISTTQAQAQAPPTPRSKPKPISQVSEGVVHPHKRRRIESPERKDEDYARDEANSRSRSKDTASVSSAANKDSLASAYGFVDTDTCSTQQNGVRSTALRKMHLHLPIPKQNRRRHRVSSPDQLSSLNNGDHGGEDFMRSARRERESRASNSDEEQTNPDELMSPKIFRASSSSTIGEDTTHTSKSSHPGPQLVTPRVPKMSTRLQESPGGAESPDPLQSPAKTSAKTFKKFAGPSTSPPLSSRAGKRFPLKRFICASLPEAEVKGYEIEVDEQKRVFAVNYQDPDLMKDAVAGSIPVSKILKVALPADDKANIIIISFSGGVSLGRQCSLDFGNSKKTLAEFLGTIHGIDPNIRTMHRASDWIISSTNANAKEMKQSRPTRNRESEEATHLAKVASHARKMSTDLQGIVRERKIDQLDAGPTDQNPRRKENGQISEKTSSNNHQHDLRTSQPTTALSVRTARETRSKATKPSPEDNKNDAIPIDVEPRHKGVMWKRPLIYPQNGKSRATVTWEDLERLNDDEFLNDNLVALFMRYLQEHMDQEYAKTMHFFNTFFYNTLTRPAEKSKSRQINYPAVANWTKTVNLFKRDYVIVPVNEAAHWYVMIICNLRSLQEPEDKDQEVIDITGPVEEEINLTEDTSKPILESDIRADKDIPADGEYADDHSTSKPTSAKKRQRLQLNRQRKYPTNQPIIITLDSLDQARSGTASALKSYLIEEAKDKYDLEIDKNSIKGMTAKNIPLQGNFSDCGLYLCMYLEQFVRDPTMFIKSILQREEKAFPWPRKLQSSALRQRLYDMIGKLHHAQINKLPANLSPIGRLLIKDEDYPTAEKPAATDMYKPEHLNPGLDFAEKHISRDNNTTSVDHMLLDGVFSQEDENRIRRLRLQATETAETIESRGSTSQPIVVEDSQEPVQKQDDTVSRHFSRKDENGLRSTNARPDTPMELAEHLRKRRSPAAQRHGKTPTTDATIDLTTPVRRPSHHNNISPTEPLEETGTRNMRADSCTTDYLTGDNTYRDRNEQIKRSDAGPYHYGSQDQQMQDADNDFTVFSDEADRSHSRDSSVVPESVQHENGDEDENGVGNGEVMLLD